MAGNNKPIIDENVRENYMKPGFEDIFNQDGLNQASSVDTDLDGEIYADQLHSLLQRISPEIESLIPKKFTPMLKKQCTQTEAQRNIKRTDEEIIWDRIHGTDLLADEIVLPNRRQQGLKKIPPRGGIFEGAFQGPKIFRQSIMTQTIRKPNGTYETRRVVRDADGTTNTTITRSTTDGKTETITSSSNDNIMGKERLMMPDEPDAAGGNNNYISSINDRNIYVTKAGYAMPMNIW